jgi:hypothetical protein
VRAAAQQRFRALVCLLERPISSVAAVHSTSSRTVRSSLKLLLPVMDVRAPTTQAEAESLVGKLLDRWDMGGRDQL